MKKGSFSMNQIAVLTIIVIAVVLVVLFLTGQWEKLVGMFGGVTHETNQSIGQLNLQQ